MKRAIILVCVLGVTGAAATAWRQLARPHKPPAAAEDPSNESEAENSAAASGLRPDEGAERGTVTVAPSPPALAGAAAALPPREAPVPPPPTPPSEPAAATKTPTPRDWFNRVVDRKSADGPRTATVREAIVASIQGGRLNGSYLDQVDCYTGACTLVLRSESTAAQATVGFEMAEMEALKGAKVFDYDRERLTTTVYVVSPELITASAAKEPSANPASPAL
jgi:hypothetical protein